MYYKSLLDFHKPGREEIHVVLTPVLFAFHRHARHWMCPHPSGSEPCPVDTAVPGISVTAAVKRRTGEMAPVFGVTYPCCLYRYRKCENKSRIVLSLPKIRNTEQFWLDIKEKRV